MGLLLLFAVVLTAFLLISEFYYAFGVRDTLEIELTRAVNIAVDLAMSDIHRQDRLSELDADIAYTRFYEYLYNDMRLSSRLEARSPGGSRIYSLEITDLFINASPPEIRAITAVSVQPLFLEHISPIQLNFKIRVNSTNRRKE